MAVTAPYGSWTSPITPTMLTDRIGLGEVTANGTDVYWVESRPAEQGRSVIVRRTTDGHVADVSPPGFDSRTRVHEYGGGAYAVQDHMVVSSRFEDQRVYRLDGAEPRPITPEPSLPGGDRYADYVFHRQLMICVRERHRPENEPINELVVFPSDGSDPPRSVASGHDFFSSPRVSPDGTKLAWLTWDHPNMPWDGTDLWMADLTSEGTVLHATRVVGGSEESIFQPEWSPDGRLHFVSDRTGWWNLYRLEESGALTALCPMNAEFGSPQGQLGLRRYAFFGNGQIVAAAEDSGISRFGLVRDGQLNTVELNRSVVTATMAVSGHRVWTVAAGPAHPAAVVGIDPVTGHEQPVRISLEFEVPHEYISPVQPITFPTTGGGVAHAWYFPPSNADFIAPKGELPPLVVWVHGGPTAAADPGLNPGRLFWTSRGFALVDVNYRGSTGYGRAYRNALRRQWGVLDTHDCIAAARYLADQGLVDKHRMAIRGGSAGGFTTLCALTFHDEFATGSSYFGVADLGALAEDTHKFESRYLDSMVGPYPESADVYRERSPIFHTERLSRPMLILQGRKDRVVLPNQAERMVAALESRAVPHAYLDFEGEGHGFRTAESLVASVNAELSFYGWVFGFQPAGDIPPLPIAHAEGRG